MSKSGNNSYCKNFLEIVLICIRTYFIFVYKQSKFLYLEIGDTFIDSYFSSAFHFEEMEKFRNLLTMQSEKVEKKLPATNEFKNFICKS